MKNQKAVIDNFSKYAECYDKYSDVQNLCAKHLIKKAKKEFNKILDIGCGTGNYTNLLRERYPSAAIRAIDISKEMIGVAERKLERKGVEFITKDAEKINLKEQFDLISSNATFQWFTNTESTLKSYKKLLKEKGVILFSTFGPRTFYELNHSLKVLLGKDILISSSGFIKKNTIKEMLKELFDEVDVEEKLYTEKHGSLLSLLKKIKYCGVRGKGLNKRSFWSPGTLAKLEAIYKKEFGDIMVTYQVFFCKGVA